MAKICLKNVVKITLRNMANKVLTPDLQSARNIQRDIHL